MASRVTGKRVAVAVGVLAAVAVIVASEWPKGAPKAGLHIVPGKTLLAEKARRARSPAVKPESGPALVSPATPEDPLADVVIAESPEDPSLAAAFHTHVGLVAPYWEKLCPTGDTLLQARCSATVWLLHSPEAPPVHTARLELAIVQHFREEPHSDQAQRWIDYIDNSASTVIQGGDPRAVPVLP